RIMPAVEETLTGICESPGQMKNLGNTGKGTGSENEPTAAGAVAFGGELMGRGVAEGHAPQQVPLDEAMREGRREEDRAGHPRGSDQAASYRRVVHCFQSRTNASLSRDR